MNDVICSFRDVQYTYPGQSSPSIQDISLDIKQGEFVLIIGESGSGKSTLIRTLNRLIPDFHGGALAGSIQVKGKPVRDWDHSQLTAEVGFVFQDPEHQMVMTEVQQELAFGLENIGIPSDQIERRLNEVISFFGLTHLWHRTTSSLSGGEKQRVAIASVMALQPNILILDEPTSQLDPTAAEEVLHLVDLLHRELGITILMVEQRLDRCLHVADRVVVMNNSRIDFAGSVDAYSLWAAENKCEALIPYVAKPFLTLVTSEYTGNNRIPVTVQQAREHMIRLTTHSQTTHANGQSAGLVNLSINKGSQSVMDGLQQPATSHMRIDVVGSERNWWKKPGNWFRKRSIHRELDTPLLQVQQLMTDVRSTLFRSGSANHEELQKTATLQDIQLDVRAGEIVSVIGPNGAGKTTFLRSIVGLQPLLKGAVHIQGVSTAHLHPEDMAGWVGYLSQNPGDYLFQETLWDECMFSLETALPFHQKRGSKTWSEQDMKELLEQLQMWKYKDQNPRDLSGGERQRAAIAAVWVQNPVLLLLDEPTRGMDQRMKQVLGEMIRAFAGQGRSVILVTHDLDFAANVSDRVAFLMDGRLIANGTPQDVFSQGIFYTTQVHRTFRQWNQRIVTLEQAQNFLQQVEAQL